MSIPRRHLPVLGAAIAASVAAPHLQASTDAKALTDKMLAALGGREAWARLRATRNDSQQNRAAEPTVVRSVITMDFAAPRFRIDTTAPGIDLSRAVDGDRHWRRTRDGRLGPYPDDLLAEDRRWHAAHVYRTIHRLARADAALAATSSRADQLDIAEGGQRLAWFRLDSRGEPYAFGAQSDDNVTVCGPWEFEAGGIRHPLWTARPDGTWRALLKALVVDPPLPDALFARPS
jgi:Ni/Co efflux regulator RcnB